MKLQPSPKIFNNYKCDFPENTIKRIEEGFQKLGLNLSFYEKSVSSSNAAVYSGYAVIDLLNASQNGKGTSPILAKASAYAELMERFSTTFMPFGIPLPPDSTKYQKLLKNMIKKDFLKGYEKVEIHESTSYENVNKYFHKKISNKNYENFKALELYDSICDAYSLTEKKYVKIPFKLIHSISGTTGLSSGNTLEEAISQGSFEIFERHAANKIIAKRITCPTINQETIKDPDVKKYIEMFKSLNIEPIVKDLTFGNKIPVVAVLFINHNLNKDKNKLKHDEYYYVIRFGSHLNLKEAIIRCFTEHLQGLNTDELVDRKYSDVLYYSWTQILGKKYNGMKDDLRFFIRFYDSNSDLSFLEKGKKISFDELTSYEFNDCLDEIKQITRICKDNNWEFLVMDYTNKVLLFPTVCVIIPPLSTDHDHFTFKCLTIEDPIERFNYYYGIKDLNYYLRNLNWINDKKKIKALIDNLEDYLSRFFIYYQFRLIREVSYFHLIDIYHILPFLYLSIKDLETAKKYFQVLIDLDSYFPEILSPFSKSINLIKQNPSFYKTYIDLIDESIKENKPLKFKLDANPFIPEKGLDNEIENMYFLLLDQINESFKKSK